MQKARAGNGTQFDRWSLTFFEIFDLHVHRHHCVSPRGASKMRRRVCRTIQMYVLLPWHELQSDSPARIIGGMRFDSVQFALHS